VPDPLIAGVALNSVSRKGAKNPAKPEEGVSHEDTKMLRPAPTQRAIFVSLC
jgi:hypothetical protein